MTSPSVDSIKVASRRLLYCLGFVLAALLALFLALLMTSGLEVTLLIILLFGALGAFISLQRRLKSLAEEDLQLIRESISYTLLAPVAGAVMAGILYLLMISGLLGGKLFPEIDTHTASAKAAEGIAKLLKVEAKEAIDYAKLLFWSFVAGFSERFVFDIIGRFADQASVQGSTGEARTR